MGSFISFCDRDNSLVNELCSQTDSQGHSSSRSQTIHHQRAHGGSRTVVVPSVYTAASCNAHIRDLEEGSELCTYSKKPAGAVGVFAGHINSTQTDLSELQSHQKRMLKESQIELIRPLELVQFKNIAKQHFGALPNFVYSDDSMKKLEHERLMKRWKVVPNAHRKLICHFCGGASCKHEDYRTQKEIGAINGLHSTWITSNIVAMQRPSSRLIRDFNIVEQFKRAAIGAIINVQLQGEHSLCGDGIHPDGFSYLPEEFMNHSISFYSMGWLDMSIPSLDHMMRLVQIMAYHVENRQKLAVHCHAGYGRTGVAIACFFVYLFGLDPSKAIDSVRERRHGCIQTVKQQEFIHEFARYCRSLRTVFFSASAPKLTLVQLLKNQSNILHGIDVIMYRHCSKIIFLCTTRLVEECENTLHNVTADIIAAFVNRCGFENASVVSSHPASTSNFHLKNESSSLSANLNATKDHYASFMLPNRKSCFLYPMWSLADEEQLTLFKESLNNNDYTSLSRYHYRFVVEALLESLDNLAEPLLPMRFVPGPFCLMPAHQTLSNAFAEVPFAHRPTINALHKLLKVLCASSQVSESLKLRMLLRLAFAMMQPPLPRPIEIQTRGVGINSDQTYLLNRMSITASRSAYNILIDFMLSFADEWPNLYDHGEKSAATNKIGVCKPCKDQTHVAPHELQ